MYNKVFQSGEFDTSFIQKEMDTLVYREKDEDIFIALFSVAHYNKQNVVQNEIEEAPDTWELRNRINI